MSFISPAAVARIDRIYQLLRQQHMTVQEIADAVFISTRYAREYMSHMRSGGLAHIVSYRKIQRETRYDYVPVYAFGPGEDAEKPLALRNIDKSREHRAKIAADPEAHDREKARRRAARIKPHRDWTAAWIPTK